MVRDISIDLWLCVFILGRVYTWLCLYLAVFILGCVYTWRHLVKPHTFLWCNTCLMAVQLTFELELLYKNEKSDIKFSKIGCEKKIQGAK